MHGKGVFTWRDGRKYVGEYLEDKYKIKKKIKLKEIIIIIF